MFNPWPVHRNSDSLGAGRAAGLDHHLHLGQVIGQRRPTLAPMPCLLRLQLRVGLLLLGLDLGRGALQILEAELELIGIERLRALAELQPTELGDDVVEPLGQRRQPRDLARRGQGQRTAHRHFADGQVDERGRQKPKLVQQPSEKQRSRGAVIQQARQGKPNASLAGAEIEAWCQPDAAGGKLLQSAIERLGLSARGYHRILKVARTIADMNAAPTVGAAHVAEAIQSRRGLGEFV